MEVYKTARSYAFKMAGNQHYLDLLHDVYLVWWDKTGKNIFDENPVRVIVVMKNVWFSQERQRTEFQYEHQRHKKSVCEFQDHHKFNSVTPLDILIENETKYRLKTLVFRRSSVPGHPELVFEMLALKQLGYRNKDVALELGVTKGLVTFFLKRAKAKLNLN